VVEVDHFDSNFGTAGNVEFRASLELCGSGGLDQVNRGGELPPGTNELPIWVTKPEPILGPYVASTGNDFGSSIGVLDIEREVHRWSNEFIELAQSRNMLREISRCDLGDGTTQWPSSDHSIVVEDSHAVRGHPHITLKTRGTEAKG
jgi:hypothetical protein